TPSARKRLACSLCSREALGKTIRPPAPTTRCQGRCNSRGATLSAYPVSRARDRAIGGDLPARDRADDLPDRLQRGALTGSAAGLAGCSSERTKHLLQ